MDLNVTGTGNIQAAMMSFSPQNWLLGSSNPKQLEVSHRGCAEEMGNMKHRNMRNPHLLYVASYLALYSLITGNNRGSKNTGHS